MDARPILKNKYYLYMTEFFAGMAVMAVELGASRLLAPYFSSSQIVWTIIIGTIMIALAAGNYWGGRSADAHPDPDRLYKRILIAAVWIAAIPVLGKYIIILISGALVLSISTHLLTIAAFLSCMVLFVFPLILLGTVTPSLAKYAMDNVGNAGKTVGMLGAYNTIGSIIGTFLPTFLTIPAVGTAITFLLFSGILLLISLIYFLSAHIEKTKAALAAVLFILCSFFGNSDSFAFWEQDLRFEGESVYNYLQVKDRGDDRILSTNVLFGVQSIMNKNSGLTGMYYDYALAAPVMAQSRPDKPLRILVLGMGTGTFAKQCQTYFPGASIQGVEIDQKITDLARTEFDLPASIDVTTYDGRAYLAGTDQKYDVIMVDAYQDITIPFHMSSLEFFTLVRQHLTDSGIMVVNMNMHSDGADSINAYLSDTIAAVFPQVSTIDVAGMTNRELFASSQIPLDSTLKQHAAVLQNRELRRLMQSLQPALIPYTKGNHMLTDDKAPVEVLGMAAMDNLIQDGVRQYQSLVQTKGIQGALKELY
jgi:spermidine synthase